MQTLPPNVFLGIALRYEIEFLEMGTNGDHVHFLMQRVPTYSPCKSVSTLKNVTAREASRRCPQVKQKRGGGEFWSGGHYLVSVVQQDHEATVRN